VILLLQQLVTKRGEEAPCHQKPYKGLTVTLRKEKKILKPFFALTGVLVNPSGKERH